MSTQDTPVAVQHPPRMAGFQFDMQEQEHHAGYNFIDGKPIFRRCLILTTVGNNKSEVNFSDVAIIDTLITMSATLKTIDGDFIVDAKIAAGDVGKKMDPTKIVIMHQGFTSASGIVIIEYTKISGS